MGGEQGVVGAGEKEGVDRFDAQGAQVLLDEEAGEGVFAIPLLDDGNKKRAGDRDDLSVGEAVLDLRLIDARCDGRPGA